MSALGKLYLFTALLCVVLAFAVPWWLPKLLPEHWLSRKITKHLTGEQRDWPVYSSSKQQKQQQYTKISENEDDTFLFPFEIVSSPVQETSMENENQQKQKQQQDDEEAVLDNRKNVKVFTKEEVAKHDGSDENLPLYLVVLGEVFDVSIGGKKFYSKGSGYNCFIGKDNSAAFHTGQFNDTVEDVRTLKSNSGVAGVVGWRSFFRKHATYKFIGVVEGLYFDGKGFPTEVLTKQVLEMAKNSKAGQAEDDRRAKLFPRCNMHFDGLKKVSNVWCEGYKADQISDEEIKKQRESKNDNNADYRVLRMVHFVSQASGVEMKDCRCLRLNKKGEAEVGASPFPTARVEHYFPEKGCDPNMPRCRMNVG